MELYMPTSTAMISSAMSVWASWPTLKKSGWTLWKLSMSSFILLSQKGSSFSQSMVSRQEPKWISRGQEDSKVLKMPRCSETNSLLKERMGLNCLTLTLYLLVLNSCSTWIPSWNFSSTTKWTQTRFTKMYVHFKFYQWILDERSSILRCYGSWRRRA